MNINSVISKYMVMIVAILLISGCANNAFYHDYIMSGQVVTKKDQKVVVCTADTAPVHPQQVFKVFRTEYDLDKIAEGEWGYERVFVGTIRIDKVQDSHFADATILSGDIVKYDMVELRGN